MAQPICEEEESSTPKRTRRSLNITTISNGTAEDDSPDNMSVEDDTSRSLLPVNGGNEVCMEDGEHYMDEDLPTVMTYKIILPDDDRVNDDYYKRSVCFPAHL